MQIKETIDNIKNKLDLLDIKIEKIKKFCMRTHMTIQEFEELVKMIGD